MTKINGRQIQRCSRAATYPSISFTSESNCTILGICLPHFQIMHLKNKAISYRQWKCKWSLKYMLVLSHRCCLCSAACTHPQRCTEVPNPVQVSLRKFFVHYVFSKNSPQATFFFTSNVVGFNFSAPAAMWIRREGAASFEAQPPCRMPRAPAHKAPAPQNHRDQTITAHHRKHLRRGTSPPHTKLASRHPYIHSNADKKKSQHLTSDSVFSQKCDSTKPTFSISCYIL